MEIYMGIGGLEFGSGVTRFPGLVYIDQYMHCLVPRCLPDHSPTVCPLSLPACASTPPSNWAVTQAAFPEQGSGMQ